MGAKGRGEVRVWADHRGEDRGEGRGGLRFFTFFFLSVLFFVTMYCEVGLLPYQNYTISYQNHAILPIIRNTTYKVCTGTPD